MITNEQGRILTRIARDAISSYIKRKKLGIDDKEKNALSAHLPVFVMVYKRGLLRGSMGFTDTIYPVYEGTAKAAVNAAFADPRFPPVEEAELDEIKVTVSVLTLPDLVEVRNPEDYLKKIVSGKDGVIIVGTFHSGLILPETAAEHKWNTVEMLRQGCAKANMPPESWQDFDLCRVYKFQSQIFRE